MTGVASGFLQSVPKCLSVAQVQTLRDQSDQLIFSSAQVGTVSAHRANYLARSCEVAFLPMDHWIAARSKEILGALGLSSSMLSRRAQYSIYRPGGHYNWHRDGKGRCFDGEYRARQVAIVFQLSDTADYIGGNLEFRTSEHREYTWHEWREVGTAIVFSCDLLHRINRIQDGMRHSVVMWSH